MGFPGDESFRRRATADGEPTEADVILDELDRALRAPEASDDNPRPPVTHFLRRRVQAVRLESARLHRELQESEGREADLRELAATLQAALDHARAENARLEYEAAQVRQVIRQLQSSSAWRLLNACRSFLRRAVPLARSQRP